MKKNESGNTVRLSAAHHCLASDGEGFIPFFVGSGRHPQKGKGGKKGRGGGYATSSSNAISPGYWIGRKAPQGVDVDNNPDSMMTSLQDVIHIYPKYSRGVGVQFLAAIAMGSGEGGREREELSHKSVMKLIHKFVDEQELAVRNLIDQFNASLDLNSAASSSDED